MKSYFTLSIFFHGAMLAFFMAAGALLSRPRMSYYSIDLVSSFPSGVAGGGAATSAPPIKIKTDVPAPTPAPIETPRASPKEFLKIPGKVKKTAPSARPAKPAAKVGKMSPSAANSSGTGTAEGPGSGQGGANGSGLMADAGPAFPYPWYLKQIADKLDQQWHPPQDFAPDTLCQVEFTISRGGQVSDSAVEKSSGDGLFDQLALRAVLYANPLPPLPSGYPDETLRVHMKFVGKRI